MSSRDPQDSLSSLPLLAILVTSLLFILFCTFCNVKRPPLLTYCINETPCLTALMETALSWPPSTKRSFPTALMNMRQRLSQYVFTHSCTNSNLYQCTRN